MQRDDGETLVERAALSVGFPSQDGSSGTVGTGVGTRTRNRRISTGFRRKRPLDARRRFSAADSLLRTRADSRRNCAIHFADLCLTRRPPALTCYCFVAGPQP